MVEQDPAADTSAAFPACPFDLAVSFSPDLGLLPICEEQYGPGFSFAFPATLTLFLLGSIGAAQIAS